MCVWMRCTFYLLVRRKNNTCRLEWLTEKGELKKPLTIAITVSDTYFSMAWSAWARSVVLLHTWRCKEVNVTEHHPHTCCTFSAHWLISGLYLDTCTASSCVNVTEPYSCHVHQEVVKEFPDMTWRVDLLHFYFSVHITVIHKVYISSFHLTKKKKKGQNWKPATSINGNNCPLE